jgi:hypothetical protein
VQKSWYGLQPGRSSHQLRKLLIYKESLNCLFTGQSKQSLDLQGFAALSTKLSTKLSTGNLDNFGAVKNQGFRLVGADLSNATSTLEPAR